MSTQIVLDLENSSGILMRIISALRKVGVQPAKQIFIETPQGNKQLLLEIEEDADMDKVAVRSQLETVKGVLQVVDMFDPRQLMLSKQEEDEIKTRYRSAASEAGDAAFRDRMLVFSLLSRYPNIANRLIEIKTAIPLDEEFKRMYEIGVTFGVYLLKNLKIDKPVRDLDSALELGIAPGLKPLVQLDWHDHTLEITKFHRNFHKRGRVESDYCQFMRGTLAGMLQEFKGLPTYHIEKTHCLDKGHPSCSYVIQPV